HKGPRGLASRPDDNPNYATRFVVLGREWPERTRNGRTSLLFGPRHQPGALADAMAVFKRHRLNLTWIESFPKRGSPQEYLFFVELEGHPRDVRVRRALASLEKKTDQVTILGAYPRTEVVD